MLDCKPLTCQSSYIAIPILQNTFKLRLYCSLRQGENEIEKGFMKRRVPREEKQDTYLIQKKVRKEQEGSAKRKMKTKVKINRE